MPRTTPMVSYAQNLEDVMLDRLFADQPAGFYVDVGAADPDAASVTRHFYEAGWRGINIEPSGQFARLAAARPRDINLNVAASEAPGRLAFVEYPDEPTRSGLARTLGAPEDRAALRRAVTREVEVRTLRDIFEEHCPGPIDFMSVDVEGHEREALAGNDWSRYRPRALVVEATLPNTTLPCHEHFEPLLLAAGYLFVYFDGINRFYLREEDRGLAHHFALPLNLFDRYKTYHQAHVEEALRDAREQARAQAEALTAAWRAEAAEARWLRGELAALRRGTGARSLRLGLWVARWVARAGRLLRRAG